MSDYPEYLNPFFEDEKAEKRKRSGSFSNTFKGFTNTLRKSFRSKSKHRKQDETTDVEIRRSTLRPSPARPTTYTPTSTYTLQKYQYQSHSPALPRSRFQERLAKSYISSLSEKELDESNPFKDDEARDVVDLEIKPVERPKRRKKRAPPPPQGEGDSNYLQVPDSSSKWSLNSGETDTSYAPSEYSEVEEPPEPLEESEEVKQVIQEFNRDMKKLTDDTNNNVIVVEEAKTDEEQNDIPAVSEETEVTEISRVAAIVRQLESSTTDDEKFRRLSKTEEIGCVEEDDDGLRKKKPGVAALAEPEDSDLDTPPQACSTPVAKVRKNKLARNELLGYEQ